MSTSHLFFFISFYFFFFFFFNDPATTEIYTLSLHDALPISPQSGCEPPSVWFATPANGGRRIGSTLRSTPSLMSTSYLSSASHPWQRPATSGTTTSRRLMAGRLATRALRPSSRPHPREVITHSG